MRTERSETERETSDERRRVEAAERRAKEVFQEAQDLAPDERSAYVESCSEQLRLRARQLLDAARRATIWFREEERGEREP